VNGEWSFSNHFQIMLEIMLDITRVIGMIRGVLLGRDDENEVWRDDLFI